MTKEIELKLRLFTFDICAHFKVIFKLMSPLMLPWQQFKGRGLNKNDRFQKIYFVNFDFRNGVIRYYLVTLPIFVKFHPQTTEIQPFKVEHSSTKTVKFHHYDLIIHVLLG